MFRPVESKPDFVAQEYEILEGWRDRRTFARLRAQNAGGPRWSFLDGPITANNPMGIHHAWGRAYKDLYQRFHAMLGEDQRYQNGFDCQGLWVEVNVERDLGFTSKRDIEAFGIARLRDPVQAARADLRRAPDRAVDPARDVDGLERPATSCAGWASCSARTPPRSRRSRAPTAPSPTRVEMLVGRLGTKDVGGSYFTFSNENNDLIWGFLAEVPPARLAVQGPRHDAVVRPLRDGHLTDRDERGLPGPGRPRADGPLPVARPAGRVAPRLDDHALDAHLERGRRGRAEPALRQGPPGRRPVLGRQGDAEDRASRATSRCSTRCPAPTWSAGATRVRSMTCPRSGRRSRQARATTPTTRTSTSSCRGARSGRTRARASSTSPRAAAPRTSSSARSSGCRSSPRSTRPGSSSTASGTWPGPTSATPPTRSSSTSSASTASTGSRRSPTATRIAGGAGRRSSSASSTSGSSAWARCTTSRARR